MKTIFNSVIEYWLSVVPYEVLFRAFSLTVYWARIPRDVQVADDVQGFRESNLVHASLARLGVLGLPN